MSGSGRLRCVLGLLALAWIGLLLPGRARAGEPVPRFEPAPCPVPAFQGVECGYLVVPEDRADPASRTIRLAIAILPARSDAPAPDPVVFLTGGPGASALASLMSWRDSPFREKRRLILVEQRGTRYAEPALDCPKVDQALVENMTLALPAGQEIAREVEAAARCRDRLQAEGVNLAAYHSAASAADLADLRRVLGYDQWNLLGVSYGTRLALTVMRDQPQGVRSVILNSPFPPQADTYVEMVPNAQQAFHALFADCQADPRCRAAYPDLEGQFYRTLEEANARPIAVAIHTPPGRVQLTAKDIIAGFYATLRAPQTNALLPFVLSQIAARNQEALAPMVESGLATLTDSSRGMLHSVECYEEAPFNPPEAIQAAAQVQPILLDYLPIHFDLAICQVWPSGQAGPLEDAPVHSDIPTLLLAGEYDPYTPPSWAERAAATLPNGYVYEFPGVGHGPLKFLPCAQEIALAFLDDPTVAPAADCIAELGPPSFVTPDDLYPTPAVYLLNVDLYTAPNPLRLGLLALCLLLFAAFLWHALVMALRRRLGPGRGAYGLAAAVAALNLAFFGGLVWVIARVSARNWLLLGFGLPAANGWLFWLPPLAALLTLGLPPLALLAWRRRWWSRRRRWFLTALALAAPAFTGLLIHWQMLRIPGA